jgi:hypothetical protein
MFDFAAGSLFFFSFSFSGPLLGVSPIFLFDGSAWLVIV